MFKGLIIATLMLSFTIVGFCNATVETWDPGTGTGTIGPGGCAYQNSCVSALNAHIINCRDLTDDEMDDADEMPGGGYNDGKWTGENPPANEDDDGNPTYAAQQVFEDDEGNIFILEDDGEITEIPA